MSQTNLYSSGFSDGYDAACKEKLFTWQPMETAPLDGTVVDIWVQDGTDPKTQRRVTSAYYDTQTLAQRSYEELTTMNETLYRVTYSSDAKYECETFQEFTYHSYEKLIAELTNAVQLAKDHELEWWTLDYASPELTPKQTKEIASLKTKFVQALRGS